MDFLECFLLCTVKFSFWNVSGNILSISSKSGCILIPRSHGFPPGYGSIPLQQSDWAVPIAHPVYEGAPSALF